MLCAVGFSDLHALWYVMIALGMLASVMFPPTLTLTAELSDPRTRGSAMGGFNLAGSLGFALGPVVGAWAQEAGGFGFAFVVAGALEILTVLVAIVVLGVWQEGGVRARVREIEEVNDACPPGRSSARPVAPAAAFAASDPKATAVADRVMEALGGAEAWNATRYLRFDFAVDREGKNLVRRAHTWDKWNGRYRLEATTSEGEPYVVLLNVNTKDGRCLAQGPEARGRGGEEVPGAGLRHVGERHLLAAHAVQDEGPRA